MYSRHPLPPEGINTTKVHPLKEFAVLTGGLLALVAIVVVVLSALADYVVDYIPFETEVRIAESVAPSLVENKGEVQQYLQALTDQLAEAQGLPAEMQVTVHYVEDPTVNALATLGGHLVVFRGLLQKLESENAIAMVLAHEVAHIHHRHPLQALGRGAVISIALATIGLASGATDVLGQAGLLTQFSFSRKQEQQSDYTALHSIAAQYGHVRGATELFALLAAEESVFSPKITFFRTHPLSADRTQNIRRYGQQQGWSATGKLTPIPLTIFKLVNGRRED
ncbi:MAG: M48 family metallopeptidase [Mariprofundaceae bacterium]